MAATYGTLPPADFVGRDDAIKITSGRLNHPEFLSTVVIGGPKIGKTSFLRYIASDEAKAHLAAHPATLRVYVDADLGGKASPFDFWSRFLRQLRLRYSGLESFLNVALKKAECQKLNMYDLEDFFDECARLELRIVAMVDNWEALLRNPNFWPPDNFLHLVRYFGQRVPRTLAFVVASQRPLLDLWDPTKGASPYYNIFLSVMIPPLKDDEIVTFVRTGMAASATELINSSVSIVRAASYGHPRLVSFVTWLCQESAKQNKPLSHDDIQQAFEDPNGPVVTLVQEIRAALSPSERQLLDIARNSPQNLSTTQKDRLGSLARCGLVPPGLRF